MYILDNLFTNINRPSRAQRWPDAFNTACIISYCTSVNPNMLEIYNMKCQDDNKLDTNV